MDVAVIGRWTCGPATLATRPAGDAAVAIGLTAHLLLLAVAGLLALAACTAAKALATPEVAT